MVNFLATFQGKYALSTIESENPDFSGIGMVAESLFDAGFTSQELAALTDIRPGTNTFEVRERVAAFFSANNVEPPKGAEAGSTWMIASMQQIVQAGGIQSMYEVQTIIDKGFLPLFPRLNDVFEYVNRRFAESEDDAGDSWSYDNAIATINDEMSTVFACSVMNLESGDKSRVIVSFSA